MHTPKPHNLDTDLAQVYRQRVSVIERAAGFLTEGEIWAPQPDGSFTMLLDVDRLAVTLRPSGEVAMPLRGPDGLGVMVLFPPDDSAQVIFLDFAFGAETHATQFLRPLWLQETLELVRGLAPGRCAAAEQAVVNATLMGEALKTVELQQALREALIPFRVLLDGQEAAMQVVEDVFGAGTGQPLGVSGGEHVEQLRELVRAATPLVPVTEDRSFPPLRAAPGDHPVSAAGAEYLSGLRRRKPASSRFMRASW